MNITIVGLGLIGGSLALSLKGFQTHIIGVDKNPEHKATALKLGIVDEILQLDEAVRSSDLVILAIPVDSARDILPFVLDLISENAVVVDMGSTKHGICENVKSHLKRKHFVASHPIAGTEYSGPNAAFSSLFTGKTTIICEKEKSADFAIDMVEKMYRIINMKIVYMPADEHDLHIAYVSHLSHISSFTLGLTVLDMEKNEKTILNMAGSGFASTVRLAKSSPEMWNPIFQQNKKHLTEALNAYIEKLTDFKNQMEADNFTELFNLMKEANKIGKIINN